MLGLTRDALQSHATEVTTLPGTFPESPQASVHSLALLFRTPRNPSGGRGTPLTPKPKKRTPQQLRSGKSSS